MSNIIQDKIRIDLDDIKQLLAQVDTDGVEPMVTVFEQDLYMREDEIEAYSMDLDIAMSNAPQLKDGMFVVPKSV